jgi:hypothetical protein
VSVERNQPLCSLHQAIKAGRDAVWYVRYRNSEKTSFFFFLGCLFHLHIRRPWPADIIYLTSHHAGKDAARLTRAVAAPIFLVRDSSELSRSPTVNWSIPVHLTSLLYYRTLWVIILLFHNFLSTTKHMQPQVGGDRMIYEGESVNRSQMDIKRNTYDIRTWRRHLFLDISSINIDTLVPSLYHCVETRNTEFFWLLSQLLQYLRFKLFFISETFVAKFWTTLRDKHFPPQAENISLWISFALNPFARKNVQ